MSEHSTPVLNVAIAVDLSAEDCAWIQELEPRVQIHRDPSLTRPQRWASDWEGDPDFARTPDQEQQYLDLLTGADALFGVPDGGSAMLATVVRNNPRLRWVQTMAAGGGAQVRAAKLTDDELNRVAFTTSAGVHGSTLAEFAVFGVLAGAKNLRRLEADQEAKSWPDRWSMRHLDEMTILVVGLGGIGQATATRFAAFGARVWGTSRSGRPVDGVERVIPLADLEGALSEVDAVVITLPGTDSTKGMIDARMFAAMKPGTILVNVGRGTVIDEDALLSALNDGTVSFAALDVFAREPLPTDSPLWEHPNVLVSPHTAALTAQESRRIATLFARNATALLDGTPLRNRVDTVEFY